MRFKRFYPKSVNFEALLLWPLLNIFLIFLLVLGFRFFMLTGDAGLDLRLPLSVSRTPVDRSSFVIIIDANGGLYWQGRAVSLKGLERELKRGVLSTTQILIKADRRVKLDLLSAVWDLCRKCGVARVTMATNG